MRVEDGGKINALEAKNASLERENVALRNDLRHTKILVRCSNTALRDSKVAHEETKIFLRKEKDSHRETQELLDLLNAHRRTTNELFQLADFARSQEKKRRRRNDINAKTDPGQHQSSNHKPAIDHENLEREKVDLLQQEQSVRGEIRMRHYHYRDWPVLHPPSALHLLTMPAAWGVMV